MIRKVGLFFIALNLSLPFIQAVIGQKHYTKNPDVIYSVNSDGENYTIDYTFKDHYNNFQNFNIKLPVDFTDNEIAAFGIPKWLFDPYIDNCDNRTIRNNELKAGFFMIQDNLIEVDKSAVIDRYAETFCKPIAELIIQSLEDYGRDTHRDRIEMAIRFVQDIPYCIPDYANSNRHFGGVSSPPGVLRNGYGDCDSKALLFAGILIYLIPADEFVFLNQPDHVLSAVQDNVKEGLTFIRYDDQDFLIAETAGPGRLFLGEKGQYYRDRFKVEPLRIVSPEVLPYKTLVTPNLPIYPVKPLGNNFLMVQNSSDLEFCFQLSLDKTHWKNFTLKKKHTGNYKFDNETLIYLRIHGKASCENIYKVQTGIAYCFSYDKKRRTWELE
jgi:hypothetical protein